MSSSISTLATSVVLALAVYADLADAIIYPATENGWHWAPALVSCTSQCGPNFACQESRMANVTSARAHSVALQVMKGPDLSHLSLSPGLTMCKTAVSSVSGDLIGNTDWFPGKKYKAAATFSFIGVPTPAATTCYFKGQQTDGTATCAAKAPTSVPANMFSPAQTNYRMCCCSNGTTAAQWAIDCPLELEYTLLGVSCSANLRGAPCRVEGDATLNIWGTNFSTVTAFGDSALSPNAVAKWDITVGGLPCIYTGNIAPIAYAHSPPFPFNQFESLQCKTPCLPTFAKAYNVVVKGEINGVWKTFTNNENNAMQVTSKAEFEFYTDINFPCFAPPTITSIKCVDNSRCINTSGLVLMVPPNELVVITGTNFGIEQPESNRVVPLRVLFDVVNCAQDTLASPESWTSTSIRIKMCASAGKNMAVAVTLGERSGVLSGTLVTVLIPQKMPQNLFLQLGTMRSDAEKTHPVVVTWTAPDACTGLNTCDSTHYEVQYIMSSQYAANPDWTLATTHSPNPGSVSTNVSLTAPGLALGDTIMVRVKMFYTAPADGQWTSVQSIQAASAPLQPLVNEIRFIGLSDGPTDHVDMLMRFNTIDYNGATPTIAKIAYTLPPATVSNAAASVQLDTKKQGHLGVIAAFPINVVATLTVTTVATRVNGLEGLLETLESPPSAVQMLRIRPPAMVTNLTATFDTAEIGATVFSATVDWTSGAEENSNAPITDHVVYARSTSESVCPVDGGGGAIADAVVCTRPAHEIAAYDRPQLGSTITRLLIPGLPIGRTSCFVVVARSALGPGNTTRDEVCIDVAAALRFRCGPGTAMVNSSKFACDDCIQGEFNKDSGATACESCATSRQYTPASGSTTCSTCREGEYASVEHSAEVCSNAYDGAVSAVPCTVCVACPPDEPRVECKEGEARWLDDTWPGTLIGDWKGSDLTYDGASTLEWVVQNRSISAEMEVHDCFNDVCCLPPGVSTTVVCDHANGYFGPLCGACDKGHPQGVYLREGYLCKRCASAEENWALLSSLTVGVFILVVYVAAFRNTSRRVGEYGGIIRRIAFSYLQMLSVLGIFKVRGTKTFNEFIGKTTEVAGGAITSGTMGMAIKCILDTQVYGRFLADMFIPLGAGILIALLTIPTTVVKRQLESYQRGQDRIMQQRREAAALSDDVPFELPRFEPIFRFGTRCCNVPSNIALRLPCMRKAATDEYISNAHRRSRGLHWAPPLERPRVNVDQRALGSIPYAILMACPSCRMPMKEMERNAWRGEAAVRKQRVTFKPHRRFIAVMVMVMYSLYPTLVASTSMMMNCSDPIGGKQYLMADLTVQCYVGWHIVYLAGASMGIAIYCIGTPVVFTLLILVDLCNVTVRKRAEGGSYNEDSSDHTNGKVCVCSCVCARRSALPWGYRTSSIRERLGLLIAGYDTHRGSLVMAWEPAVVMLRKLCITLAGTLARDPYVQVMLALMILIVALAVQALVQPYESKMLNVLDVGSLVVLLATQVLSILYFYFDTLKGTNRNDLEMAMTILLFIANAAVIVVLFGAYVLRVLFEKASVLAKKAHALEGQAGEEAGAGDVELKSFSKARAKKAVRNVAKRMSHHMRENPLGRGKKKSRGASFIRMDASAVKMLHVEIEDLKEQLAVFGGKSWWEVIPLGSKVMHPKRGEGEVVAIHPDQEKKVTIEFEGEEQHTYNRASWKKFHILAKLQETIARQSPPVSPQRNAGGLRLPLETVIDEEDEAVEDEGGILEEEEDGWYYEYDAETHGPFPLVELMEWRDSERLENDQSIRCGEAGASISLLEALYNAGLDNDVLWYADHGDGDVHGPFPLAQVLEWVNDGYFCLTDTVYRSQCGDEVELSTMLRFAEDGVLYTKAAFIEQFGGIDEWEAALDP
mgnify:CR=1 FL=1